MAKRGEYFESELGPNGKPIVPDETFLVAKEEHLQQWYHDPAWEDDDAPDPQIRFRAVYPGTEEWDMLEAGGHELEEGMCFAKVSAIRAITDSDDGGDDGRIFVLDDARLAS